MLGEGKVDENNSIILCLAGCVVGAVGDRWQSNSLVFIRVDNMGSLSVFLIALLCFQDPDAPTPMAECVKALSMVPMTKHDVFYDLGCGDGRLCILAALKYKCAAVGIDRDREKVWAAREAVRMNAVGHLVTIYRLDLRDVDVAALPATVIYVYLPRPLLAELTPQFRRHKGVKVISYMHRLLVAHKRRLGDCFLYEFRGGGK